MTYLFYLVDNLTQQSNQHSNCNTECNKHSCKEYKNIQKIILVPIEIIYFRSEVRGSFVSVDIFNPVSGLLDGGSRTVTQQPRDATGVTLEAIQGKIYVHGYKET